MGLFYRFEGKGRMRKKQTHKTRPSGRVLCVQGEGQGERGGEHVEHARLGVFYGFEGKGRMREE